MTIETKYDVGDKVFIFHPDRYAINEFEINDVDIEKIEYCGTYRAIYSFKDRERCYKPGEKLEHNVFRTAEDALNSLTISRL